MKHSSQKSLCTASQSVTAKKVFLGSTLWYTPKVNLAQRKGGGGRWRWPKRGEWGWKETLLGAMGADDVLLSSRLETGIVL